MNRDLEDERREYERDEMGLAHLPADPMELFSQWLQKAMQLGIPDPTAMTLSTVDPEGNPSSRIVLLKKVEEGKLVFYTNYQSKKSRDIKANNRIATHFYWPGLEQQVRINGTVRAIDKEESDHYFRSRPYESKISAWLSPQSEEIPDRAYLEKRFEEYCKRFPDSVEIPRPDHWGGFAIHPTRIEFWQGGSKRLHDRIVYSRNGELWSSVRLAP